APAIVTDAPTAPDVGVRLVTLGVASTVKLWPLLLTLLTRTTTFPLVALAGTVTTMLAALHVVTAAVVPLNLTVEVPCVAPKPLPAIVTDAPTAPDVGVRLEIVGAAAAPAGTATMSNGSSNDRNKGGTAFGRPAAARELVANGGRRQMQRHTNPVFGTPPAFHDRIGIGSRACPFAKRVGPSTHEAARIIANGSRTNNREDSPSIAFRRRLLRCMSLPSVHTLTRQSQAAIVIEARPISGWRRRAQTSSKLCGRSRRVKRSAVLDRRHVLVQFELPAKLRRTHVPYVN